MIFLILFDIRNMLEIVPDIAQTTHGIRNIFAEIRNVPTGVPCDMWGGDLVIFACYLLKYEEDEILRLERNFITFCQKFRRLQQSSPCVFEKERAS